MFMSLGGQTAFAQLKVWTKKAEIPVAVVKMSFTLGANHIILHSWRRWCDRHSAKKYHQHSKIKIKIKIKY
jgi:hypothetical protein